jgi:flagellar biosynthesis/type III secretory pathway ATPase
VEDLVSIGAYVKGSNPKVDRALQKLDSAQAFLKQSREENAGWNDTQQKMKGFLN